MGTVIDIHELARMVRAKRGRRPLRDVAKEIGDVSASTLSRIEKGKVPDLDTFIHLCKWLGVSADHFTEDSGGESKESESNTPDIVVAHLRADRTLDPETAEALVTMIQVAYNAVDQGQIGKPKGENASRLQNLG